MNVLIIMHEAFCANTGMCIWVTTIAHSDKQTDDVEVLYNIENNIYMYIIILFIL